MNHRRLSLRATSWAVFFALATSGVCLAEVVEIKGEGATRLLPNHGTLSNESSELVADERLSGGQGITLKAGVTAATDDASRPPDVSFELKAPRPGLYVLHTYAVVDAEGDKLMAEAKGKYDSLFLALQFDDHRPTRRVVYVPWHRPQQETGKFHLTGEAQTLKIWLPRGVRLGYVDIRPYVPPAVPAAARDYQPRWTPPASRPRLWCNAETLPIIRERLGADEHREAWQRMTKEAKQSFEFEYSPEREVAHDAKLEEAATAKAFYYLMTGDEKIGREAIELIDPYLGLVEFGNVLDITREIGRAIYTGSLVYDWCHDLLKAEEEERLYDNLMRLALDMECGWPPFRQSIITGHGAEAQINRDLLAMSIAIHDRNPDAFRYTAYAVLENLVPMRKFEFQSPRYNQGVSYGAFRFGWEMHSAWLFYRMTGEPAFDENVKEVRKFWQYMRMPDGMMLRDGDGSNSAREGTFSYWKYPQTMLLMYAYANDPILKADFYRQGGPASAPMLFLLLNDPELEPVESMESLPLTKEFGPILGSMVARTGWDISLDSNDVVAEIKGGGYHFGNHQHSDAGSLQVYYRGLQVADLGMYKFYGTPYDVNFNKRSVAHSMMLARDPDEKFLSTEVNDGGTRYNQTAPRTPKQVQSDPLLNNGTVISATFGPSDLRPAFSYFKADLTKAYSAKMAKYARGFCFLNLDRPDVPAAIILTDDMTTAKAEFTKYWQVNTLFEPKLTDDGFILWNERNDRIGNTHAQMLVPAPADRHVELLSGKQAANVFGTQLEPPPSSRPEAAAHRILISPNEARPRDRFLTVFQMVDGQSEPLPIEFSEREETYEIGIADRIVVIGNSADLVQHAHTVTVPDGEPRRVALLGLKPGQWTVRGPDGQVHVQADVEAGKNAVYFEAAPGVYEVAP